MKVFIKGPRCKYYGNGEFDLETGHLTVFKGAHLKTKYLKPTTKMPLVKISQYVKEFTTDGVLNCDIEFSSPSAAATFMTGNSANGWKYWKDGSGNPLEDYRRKK